MPRPAARFALDEMNRVLDVGPSVMAEPLGGGSGEVEVVPAYEAGNERAAMAFPDDYYASPARGAVPAWRNEMATLSWPHWLGFDGLRSASAAGRAGVASLFVHSDDCVFPAVLREVAAQAGGELCWLSGGQLDFYDHPAQVDAAIEAAVAHFTRTLPHGKER